MGRTRKRASAGRPTSASLADMPAPWLSELVQQLAPSSLLVLFQSCNTLAAAVLAHAPCTHLRPAPSLSPSRRSLLMRWAATADQLHLHLRKPLLPYDRRVWPCIKQLTLHLTRPISQAEDMYHLHVDSLDSLHTLVLDLLPDYTQPGSVRWAVDGWTASVRKGGLPALKCLGVLSQSARRSPDSAWRFPDYAASAVYQLAPALSPRITVLIVDQPQALRSHIPSFPQLQEVRVLPHPGPSKLSADDAHRLVTQPNLRVVQLPHWPGLPWGKKHASCSWQTLRLTEVTSICQLHDLPDGLQHVELTSSCMGVTLHDHWTESRERCLERHEEALAKLRSLDWVWESGTWTTHMPGQRRGARYCLGLSQGPCVSDKPHAVAMSVLLPQVKQPVLSIQQVRLSSQLVEQLSEHLPHTVTGLCFSACTAPGDGVAWWQVLQALPKHVTCLQLDGISVEMEQLRACLEAMPQLQELVVMCSKKKEVQAWKLETASLTAELQPRLHFKMSTGLGS